MFTSSSLTNGCKAAGAQANSKNAALKGGIFAAAYFSQLYRKQILTLNTMIYKPYIGPPGPPGPPIPPIAAVTKLPPYLIAIKA